MISLLAEKIKRFKEEKALDSETASCLLLVHALLVSGESFERVLESVPGAAGERLKRAALRIRKGEKAHESLAQEKNNSPSEYFSRACDELARTYYTGTSENLAALAKNISRERQNKVKEYNSKMIMYSLFFVVSAAVLPAMFESFLIIGSSFMDISISPEQAFLITVVGFPALSAFSVLLAIIKRPG